MGQLDNALREQATPYLGQIAGYNRSDQSDLDVTKAIQYGDLYNLTNLGNPTYVPLKNNLIRILRPQFLALTAAYFTFSLTTANAETSPKFFLTVDSGYAAPTAITPTVPTDDQILACHTRLKGDANPFTTPNGSAGTITINRLNILKELPKPTDTNYREDCFVVGIHFLQAPANGAGYKLSKFELNMAGVITHG